MTDKIIIDGVDVRGCKYLYDDNLCKLTKEQAYDDEEFVSFCKGCLNCYYKQLARKTKECEKWKSYYDLYSQNRDILKKIQAIVNSHPGYGVELTETGVIDKDERIACLEVNEQIELIFNEFEQQLQAEKYKVEELKKDLNNYKKQYRWNQIYKIKYKQAFKEIKEIADKLLKTATNDYEDSIAHEILQKCEVLND